jgi:hypothetical protein
LESRHRLQSDRDKINNDENDDESTDDQPGPVADRAMLQDFIQAAPQIRHGAPNISWHS